MKTLTIVGTGRLSGHIRTALNRIHQFCIDAYDAQQSARKDSGEWHKRSGQILAYAQMTGVLASLEEVIAREASEQLDSKRVQAAKESEDRYSDLVEHSQDLIYTHDLQGILLSINQAPLKILGYSSDEILNRPLRNLVTPEAKTKCDEYLERISRDGFAKGLLPVLTKEGQTRLWEYNNTVRMDGVGVPIVRGMAHDITEQKKAQRALQKSEEKFSKAFALSPLLLSICTLKEGRFIEVNETFVRQSGYSREELIGQTVSELGLWCDPVQREALVEEILLGGSIRNREAKFCNRSGQIGLLLLSVEVLEIAGEKCLLTVGHDITSQKAVEQALRNSEEKFRLMAENIKEIFWIIEPKTYKLIYASPAYEQIWERSREEIELDPTAYLKSIHPEDAPRILEKLARLESVDHLEDEYRIVCPDGRIKWVFSRASTVWDSNWRQATFVGTTQDITERRENEEALRQAQKMEAVGLLASGVAHDFNNILTGILAYSELLLKSVDINDGRRDRLQNIVNAALQGRNLTGKLLAFNDEILATYPVDVDTEIQQSADILRRLIDENIEIALKCGCKERVLLASGLLYQVVLNLAINAKDAMPRGGRLCISTASVEVTAQNAQPTGIPAGRYLRLCVSDTGCGMSSEVQKRIFEPFFTTKSTARGTGLGLFTVFSIVRQCSGHIRVHSKPGEGATFDLYFPIVKMGAPEYHEAAKHAPRGTSGNLVMVVEDNRQVRNALHDQLVDLGYSVLCEDTPIQATLDIRRLGKKLDLVVTDVVMPELNGPDLVEKLREVQPNLRVLYVTGYANQHILSKEALDAYTDLLHKPFTQRELGLKVRSLLILRSNAKSA